MRDFFGNQESLNPQVGQEVIEKIDSMGTGNEAVFHPDTGFNQFSRPCGFLSYDN
jgi:hypothetical protein